MSRMTPFELLLANLKGEIPNRRREFRTKADAYATLKRLTGQDFGENAVKWEKWIKNNPDHLRRVANGEQRNDFLSKYSLKENETEETD